MTLLVQTLLFLLGMSLCIQLIAALYGIIDLRHTVEGAYRQVIRRILFWSTLTLAVIWPLSGHLRAALLWGMATYVVFFFFTFHASRLFLMRNRRSINNE